MNLIKKIVRRLVGEGENDISSFIKGLRGCKDDQLVAEEPC